MRILKALSGIQAPRIPKSKAVISRTQSQDRTGLEALHRPEVGIDSFNLGE